jgi:hypothetical protein
MSFSPEVAWSALDSISALTSSPPKTEETVGEIMDYFVSWEIELAARSPIEAARQARSAQIKHGTMATVFDVYSADAENVVRVDLTAVAETEMVREPEAQNVFSTVELATILHSLRLLRRSRLPAQVGRVETPQGYDVPAMGLHPSAEIFGKEISLSNLQIDALCKRIEVSLA